MVKIEDLKRINLLKDVPDQLLEVIATEASLSIFGADTLLITVAERVDTFHMLVMGQVMIKHALTPEIDVILDYIQSGASFGTAAFIRGARSTYTAVCQEPCEVISLSGERMMQLFEENHELAYYMMRGVSLQYKRYMDARAHMIMKTLDENPEFKEDIHDIENLTLVI